MVALAPPWIQVSLAWILAANAADLVMTLWGIQAQRIIEANPIMGPVMSVSPAAAILLKFALVVGGVLALYWAYPRRPVFTGVAILFLCGVMAMVMGLHAVWILT